MKKHRCVVLKRVYTSSARNRQDEKSTLRGAIYVDEITRHHRTQIHCNYKELLRKRDTSTKESFWSRATNNAPRTSKISSQKVAKILLSVIVIYYIVILGFLPRTSFFRARFFLQLYLYSAFPSQSLIFLAICLLARTESLLPIACADANISNFAA